MACWRVTSCSTRKTDSSFVAALIKDTKEDFLVRYAALRCMRFFWEYRDDVLKKASIVDSLKPLLDQPDIVDLAVEDLRKWQQWDLAPKLVQLVRQARRTTCRSSSEVLSSTLSAAPSDEPKPLPSFLVRMRADPKQAERVATWSNCWNWRSRGRSRQRRRKDRSTFHSKRTAGLCRPFVFPIGAGMYDRTSQLIGVCERSRMNRRAVALLLYLRIAASAPAPIATRRVRNCRRYRQEARNSRIVVIGTLSNPRLVGGDSGLTDLNVEHVIKDDPALDKKRTLTLPRWTPVDRKKPPRVLVFFDVYEDKLDPFRGVNLRGDSASEYLRGGLALDDRDRVTTLLYYFRHLDSSDPDVAADAFLEFAKAADQEVGAVGPKLDPAKLRKLLADPKTPPERLGVFAYLLGACGTKSDADTLAKLLEKGDERTAAAVSGILGGLIQMRPNDGWKRAIALIEDPKRPYQDKLAVLGTLRFFHAYQPEEHRKAIVAGMSAVVARGDMADMAIEDLRRWKWWDLTRHIVAQYQQPTHTAPLVKNAILRYALTCPDEAAAAFVQTVAASEPALVREVKESLEFERPSPPKPSHDQFGNPLYPLPCPARRNRGRLAGRRCGDRLAG